MKKRNEKRCDYSQEIIGTRRAILKKYIYEYLTKQGYEIYKPNKYGILHRVLFLPLMFIVFVTFAVAQTPFSVNNPNGNIIQATIPNQYSIYANYSNFTGDPLNYNHTDILTSSSIGGYGNYITGQWNMDLAQFVQYLSYGRYSGTNTIFCCSVIGGSITGNHLLYYPQLEGSGSTYAFSDDSTIYSGLNNFTNQNIFTANNTFKNISVDTAFMKFINLDNGFMTYVKNLLGTGFNAFVYTSLTTFITSDYANYLALDSTNDVTAVAGGSVLSLLGPVIQYNGKTGLDRNFKMLNSTNDLCYMNYTSGALTWSTC